MSAENNLIECTYGHHMTDKTNFTPSGLNGHYYTICRECNNKRQKKYMKKHNKEYNDSVREYKRQWIANKRAQKKRLLN